MTARRARGAVAYITKSIDWLGIVFLPQDII